MYILNLHFKPLLDDTNIERLTRALKFVYPTITWKDGRDIDIEYSKKLLKRSAMVGVEKLNEHDIDLVRSPSYLEAGRYGLPEPIDGYKWIDEQMAKLRNEEGGFEETMGLFDSLNESQKTFNIFEDNFVLKFNPSIGSSDWFRVAELIEVVIPNLQWSNKKKLSEYNPISQEIHDDEDGLTYIFVYPIEKNGTRRVMWDTSLYRPHPDDGPVIDGWDIIKLDSEDLFNQLNEQEDDNLQWAKDIINNQEINIGDVFYIVDSGSSREPDWYRPDNVRYVFVIEGFFEGSKEVSDYGIEDTIFVKYKPCNPDNVTYNPDDYQVSKPKCRYYEDASEKYVSGINWAQRLINTKYWRKM